MDSLDHCFCMFQMGKSFENEKVEHSCMQTTGEADETGTSTGSSSSEQMAAVVRRVDLIVAPHKQFPFALLGWTGSKVHDSVFQQCKISVISPLCLLPKL